MHPAGLRTDSTFGPYQLMPNRAHPIDSLQSGPVLEPRTSRPPVEVARVVVTGTMPTGVFMRLSELFLLLLISLSGAAAQVSSTGPQNLYNGQTVTTVDLIANPHRDVEPLRAAVSQKAGKPYSQADVEASISALQVAGGFEKVTVNVIPDISGLRLNFILEPAYYLGMVDFQGATKFFSYTRVLQVVNLQEEDPYDKARIPVAEAALLQFLQQLRSASASSRQVVVIAENTRYHHSRLHRPWRDQHAPHFALDFLPAYSPQLNPIERVWKLTRRRCLHIDVLPARLIGDRAYDSDPLDRRLERDYSIELIRPTGRTAIRPKTGASCDDTSDVGVSNGCLPGCSGSGD